MEEAVIVSAVRTAIGRFGGVLSTVSAVELGSTVTRAALERAGVAPEEVDEAILGCCGQFGEEAHVARLASQRAGLPEHVPAYNVNRMCGSGLQAIINAAQAIELGEADVVVAGGTECMSQMPYSLPRARWGYRMGDATAIDTMLIVLGCPFNHYHMGITAENVAHKYAVSREDQDAFAVESQQKAGAAMQAGRFAAQIVPVQAPQERGGPKQVDTDEHPRPETTIEGLQRLRPAFKPDGTVTAGNASGINDGAAAVVVMSRAQARSRGLTPLAVVRQRACAGVDPALMGMGPVPAVRKLLDRAALGLKDIDLIEMNEAFAAPAVACGRELGIDWERTNVNGGAIALGHPIGATGAVLTVKLLYEMQARQVRRGLATLCIGGGQGIACLFEAVS